MGTSNKPCRPQRNAADGVVGNVPLVVGVDQILRGPAPCGERGGKLRPVRRRVHLVERQRVERGIVEGPLEGDGRVARGENRVHERPVLGGLNIENDILAAAHVDDFAIDGERMPLCVVALVVALAVELFVVEVLYVGLERGKSPGHVLVVAGDDERQPGQRDARGVKARRAQIGHVPCVRLAQGQVHVVREQRLAAGGVAAGHHPVVRSRRAAVAVGESQQSQQRGCVFMSNAGEIGALAGAPRVSVFSSSSSSSSFFLWARAAAAARSGPL